MAIFSGSLSRAARVEIDGGKATDAALYRGLKITAAVSAIESAPANRTIAVNSRSPIALS
jgi:hypothetical protein